MNEPIAYLKGQYVPLSECKLAIYDLGIVLGASVTDFLRTFNQKPYRMEDHRSQLQGRSGTGARACILYYSRRKQCLRRSSGIVRRT